MKKVYFFGFFINFSQVPKIFTKFSKNFNSLGRDCVGYCRIVRYSNGLKEEFEHDV